MCIATFSPLVGKWLVKIQSCSISLCYSNKIQAFCLASSLLTGFFRQFNAIWFAISKLLLRMPVSSIESYFRYQAVDQCFSKHWCMLFSELGLMAHFTYVAGKNWKMKKNVLFSELMLHLCALGVFLSEKQGRRRVRMLTSAKTSNLLWGG